MLDMFSDIFLGIYKFSEPFVEFYEKVLWLTQPATIVPKYWLPRSVNVTEREPIIQDMYVLTDTARQ